MPIVLKSGSLNLPEPSGSVQACNGIGLLLPFCVFKEVMYLVAATRWTGLEGSADKTKYMVMSRDQNAGRIHSVRIVNSIFREGGRV